MQQFTIGKFTNLRGHRSRRERPPFNPELFRRWRASVPYTNEEIARVYIAMAVEIEQASPFMAKRYLQTADWIRAGNLSAKALNAALPALVTKCALCGKPALYRYGCEGRCRVHKYNATVGASRRNAINEARSREIGKQGAAIDRTIKANQQVRKLHRGRRRKK